VKKLRWQPFYIPDPAIVVPIATAVLFVGSWTIWFGPYGGLPSREYTLTFKSIGDLCLVPPQTVVQLDAQRQKVKWARAPGEGIKVSSVTLVSKGTISAAIDYSKTGYVTLNGTLDNNYGSGNWASDTCSGTWTGASNMRINKGWW
jgi:hypothetical protein